MARTNTEAVAMGFCQVQLLVFLAVAHAGGVKIYASFWHVFCPRALETLMRSFGALLALCLVWPFTLAPYKAHACAARRCSRV